MRGIENNCIFQEKEDAIGCYLVCECEQTGGEGTCCHTILRNGDPESKGTCNPSPPSNCVGGTKCVDGDPDEDQVDYLCDDP